MRPSLALFSGLGLLAAACGAPSEAPTPTQSAPTARSAAAPSSAPPASSSPIAVVSPVPAPVAAVSPAASPSPLASAGPTRFSLVSEASEARFRVKEQFVGIAAPGDAVGTSQQVSGSIVLGPNGAVVPTESKLKLDLRTLKSDQSNRDNYIRRNTLQTDQFPTAELVVREAQGLPDPLPTSGQATFKLLGELTVHGVARPTTWDLTAQFNGQEVKGQGKTAVTLTEFGMEIPRVARIASIEDNVRLEIDFTARKS